MGLGVSILGFVLRALLGLGLPFRRKGYANTTERPRSPRKPIQASSFLEYSLYSPSVQQNVSQKSYAYLCIQRTGHVACSVHINSTGRPLPARSSTRHLPMMSSFVLHACATSKAAAREQPRSYASHVLATGLSAGSTSFLIVCDGVQNGTLERLSPLIATTALTRRLQAWQYKGLNN